MRIPVATVLALIVVSTSGCTTYRAYPGKKRPRAEVARLEVPWTDLAIDDHQIAEDNVRDIELLPGRHVVEWAFTYPNRHRKTERLSFEAQPGGAYRLGERFFPDPHPGGPVGALVDLAVGTAWLPFSLIFPAEPATEPAPGEYYGWIVDVDTRQVVAGQAPDVPQAHTPITFVPPEEP